MFKITWSIVFAFETRILFLYAIQTSLSGLLEIDMTVIIEHSLFLVNYQSLALSSCINVYFGNEVDVNYLLIVAEFGLILAIFTFAAQ